MPEGNVIHYQARRLGRLLVGDQVQVESPQGRFAADAAKVDGKVLGSVEAFGKHLLIGFDPLWIHIHLGLFGKWRMGKGEPPPEAGQIRLRLTSTRGYAELRGPTVCALIDGEEKTRVLSRIGPDPIRKDDPEPVWLRLQRSSAPIGALLMNQAVIAGVGNIYRAEVLFRLNCSPFREGRRLSRNEFDELWKDLVELMAAGTRRGRIHTVRPEHLPEAMGREPRRDRHGGEVYVYRRSGHPCHLCGALIEMTQMQGRKLYWCPDCQPE